MCNVNIIKKNNLTQIVSQHLILQRAQPTNVKQSSYLRAATRTELQNINKTKVVNLIIYVFALEQRFENKL